MIRWSPRCQRLRALPPRARARRAVRVALSQSSLPITQKQEDRVKWRRDKQPSDELGLGLTWRRLCRQRESSRQAVALHLLCRTYCGLSRPRPHVALSAAWPGDGGGQLLPLPLQLLLTLLSCSDLLLDHRQRPLLLGAQAEGPAGGLRFGGS